jgi:hypothetical protein
MMSSMPPLQSRGGSTTPCVFCRRVGPGVKISRQHPLPEWLTTPLAPLARGRDFQIVSARLNTFTGSTVTKIKATVPSPSQAPIKGPCRECNHGWMGDLENLVRPVIQDILTGGAPLITPELQQALAAWVAAIALMVDIYEPSQSACSSDQYHWMYLHHTPPPDWYVWIAAYGGPPTVEVQHRGIPISLEEPAYREEHVVNTANATSIIAGRVVFHVFGTQVSFRLPDMPTSVRDHVRSIWPPQPAFTWPPGQQLLRTEFTTLHNAIVAELVGPARHV